MLPLIQICLIIFILVLVTYSKSQTTEHYSMGALTQLMAKGPQDTYLTGDAAKYMALYYPYGYPNFVWNNPTRLYNKYFPYYYYSGLFPYRFYPRMVPYG